VASSLAGVPASLRIGGEFRSEFARLMKKIVPDSEVWKHKLEAELAAAQHALDAVEAAALQGWVRYGEMWGDVGRYGETWGDMGRYGEIWGDMEAAEAAAALQGRVSPI
jgi:hypothetical protein